MDFKSSPSYRHPRNLRAVETSELRSLRIVREFHNFIHNRDDESGHPQSKTRHLTGQVRCALAAGFWLARIERRTRPKVVLISCIMKTLREKLIGKAVCPWDRLDMKITRVESPPGNTPFGSMHLRNSRPWPIAVRCGTLGWSGVSEGRVCIAPHMVAASLTKPRPNNSTGPEHSNGNSADR